MENKQHQYHFTEDDQQKVADFLNFIAKKAEFTNWKTEDTIQHFKLLAHMQQVILPKIKSHIFEIKRVIEEPKKASVEKKSTDSTPRNPKTRSSK